MTSAQLNSLVARIVEKNAQMLMSEFNEPMDKTFAFIYSSKTFDLLEDENSGLRSQSADYVYQRLKDEFLAKK